MDFTISQYKALILAFKNAKYNFMTMEQFMMSSDHEKRTIVLRHDVDEKPYNALKIAKAEHELDIKATYYFRIVKISNSPEIIRKIVDLGHEIGYHYEDLATQNGDFEKAIKAFAENLKYFRQFYSVQTVCMHGSSMSDYDNRELWGKYRLKDFSLIGEPYLSIDYDKVFYMTDTGMCWDGGKYSVRDFVKNNFGIHFHHSNDIILGINQNIMPDQVILQSHTLWTDSSIEWCSIALREFFRIRIKMTIIKYPKLKEFVYNLIKKYSN